MKTEIDDPLQTRLKRLVHGLLSEKANPEGVYRKILQLGLDNNMTLADFKARLKNTSLPASTAHQIARIYEDPNSARACVEKRQSVRRGIQGGTQNPKPIDERLASAADRALETLSGGQYWVRRELVWVVSGQIWDLEFTPAPGLE